MPGRDDSNDELRVAFHEAGHAVAAALLGIRFDRVYVATPEQRKKLRGGEPVGKVVREFYHIWFRGMPDKQAKEQIVQMMAGPIAEQLAYVGLVVRLDNEQEDMRDDVGLSLIYKFCEFEENEEGKRVVTSDEKARKAPQIMRFIHEASAAAEKLVNQNQATIRNVAYILKTKYELSESDVCVACGIDLPDGTAS
jgi:ATP-dependent Zn protease